MIFLKGTAKHPAVPFISERKIDMKFKKFLCGILAATVLIVPALSGCKHVDKKNLFKTESSSPTSAASQPETSQNPETPSQNAITPLMWKAEDQNGNYAYLFGSIHAGDNAVDNLPDYFEKAYADSDTLAFEIDMSDMYSELTASSSMLTDVIYADGTTIKDHISENTYNKLVQILKENGMYNALYDYYKPLMWESLIENLSIVKAGLNPTKGVDLTLTNRAKADGKTIEEVESMDFQISMFNGLSDNVVEMLLSSYAEDGIVEKQAHQLKDLYEKWKSGTITEKDLQDEDFDESQLTDEEKAAFEEYNNALLTDRNKGMTEKLTDYIKSGKTVMLVVGTAHFLGDDGIIALLEEQGFTVTQITSADQLETREIQKAA